MARLSRLVGLGLGSALALLGVNAAAFHFNSGRSTENQQRLAQSQTTLQKLQNTFSLLKDAETGQRGYLLTGKVRYLEPYRAAIAPINRQVRELRQLTADSPPQQAQLRLLEPAIAQKLAEMQTTIKLRQTQGLEAEKAALRLVQTDRGQQLMETIRRQVATMETEQNQQVAARSQALAASLNQTWLTFLTLNGLASLLLALALYWIWRDRQSKPAVQSSVLEPPTEELSLAAAAPDQLSTQIDLTPEPIDLLHIIEDSLRQLTPHLQARDAEIRVARPLPIVLSHRPSLLRAVTYLIHQALKAAPDDRPVVKIYADAAQNSACLWIEDNGSGIVPAYQEAVFCSQAVQSSETRTSPVAIVRAGLQRLGGQMGVESQLGQGNCFWIALPTVDLSDRNEALTKAEC